MKMEFLKNIQKRIRKNLLAVMLSGFLIGNGLLANGSEAKNSSLEEKISKPKINFLVEGEIENHNAPLDYLSSETLFSIDIKLDRVYNVPELSSEEEYQVENLINDIKNKKINSYNELVEKSRNLSENQKIVLFSAISHLMYRYNYDLKLMKEYILSQDDFFKKLQDSLASNTKNGIGTCGHISSHIEQLANDAGLRSSQVSGVVGDVNHFYVISKTEKGSAVIDSYNIFTTNTKNIEKTLEAYQKYIGSSVFDRVFLENAEFKYRSITKDGQHFLDFIDYDESSKPLKNYLISEKELSPKLSLEMDFGTYLKSFEINCFGLFGKIGEITGDSNSPMNWATLFQTGFKRKFLTSTFDNPCLNTLFGNKIIYFNGNFLSGNLYDSDRKEIGGMSGDLVFSSNNEKFNFDFRVAGNIYSSIPIHDCSRIFSDFLVGTGASYKIESEKMDILPYIIAQSSIFPGDVSTFKWKPKFSEMSLGNIFDIKISNSQISLDPYYTWRIWENEFGGAIEFKNRNARANIGGYITKSKYDFCPDKIGLKIGLEGVLKNLHQLDNPILRFAHEIKKTDYDGEKELDYSLKASINIKY
jgi:hypothetical protein